MISVGQRLSDLWEEWLSQVASAESLYDIWSIYPMPFPVRA
jgi:hypothetical protein